LFIRALLLWGFQPGSPGGAGPDKANYLNNIQKEIDGKEKKWRPENRAKDLWVWVRVLFIPEKKLNPNPPAFKKKAGP
jgi:hypothetical protein